MAKDVTLRSIGEALGISAVSVSKALSDKEGVSDEMREIIKHKADEMGYEYKSKLTKEIKNQNHKIGVLIASRYISENAFYSQINTVILQETTRHSDTCIMEILSEEHEQTLVSPNMVTNRSVDGMIILGQLSNKYIEMLKNCPVPYIFMDFYSANYNIDSVVSDNMYGSYLITSYLISKGYKNIAFVGSIKATSSICDRYLGYQKALIENNLPLRAEYIIEDRDEAGKFIPLTLPEDTPDSFVCNCDNIAFFLVQQLKDLGYRLPEDIAVVGYDDYIYSSLCTPQLTTIRVNMEEMVHKAYKMIVSKINSPGIHFGRKVINGKLIVRDSVRSRN
ncbi:MAG: LacI family DNA-binding transcriptional regulator [Butyrivibrio sp.]|nr:LacI family DNA-binding transcriptional regulator [Butyrivibrio sp.]